MPLPTNCRCSTKRCFVGAGTVKTHVANSFAKLGVPTRAAAAHTVRHRLV